MLINKIAQIEQLIHGVKKREDDNVKRIKRNKNALVYRDKRLPLLASDIDSLEIP